MFCCGMGKFFLVRLRYVCCKINRRGGGGVKEEGTRERVSESREDQLK